MEISPRSLSGYLRKWWEIGWNWIGAYPLVNIQKNIENGHLYWIYPLKKMWFSIAMLNFQRVSILFISKLVGEWFIQPWPMGAMGYSSKLLLITPMNMTCCVLWMLIAHPSKAWSMILKIDIENRTACTLRVGVQYTVCDWTPTTLHDLKKTYMAVE